MINLEVFIRRALKVYRGFLHRVFDLSRRSTMPPGEACCVEHFKFEQNNGDVVHPCVRYSINAFRGHHWWMVYTPYYDANASIENPILCFGVNKSDTGPIEWFPYMEIIGTPDTGYNSDPTMFFESGKLYIYWRENFTTKTSRDGLSRATYGCILSESDIVYGDIPILSEQKEFEDKQVSPVILNSPRGYLGYAMHITFINPKLRAANKYFDRLIRYLVGALATLEIFSDKKSHGISIWRSDNPSDSFKYIRTVPIENCNRLYKPWHLDCFEYGNRLFAVIQTTQCNADICLAVSDDWDNFVMYSNPLITNESIDKVGLYKPTAFVHKDIFYLYYTAQNHNDRSLNMLYVTHMPFKEVLDKIA